MLSTSFTAFDPLAAKSLAQTEVAVLAQKREIKNILSSYVGWYDVFSELIQNALDSIEERAKEEEFKGNKSYVPTIRLIIDIQDNSLIVSDNGVGLDEDKFMKFLCPDISFKSGKTRGHKGVGATYLAYGFNYIQVASKSNSYTAVGKMENARRWLDDENPAGNPHMKPDTDEPRDSVFSNVDRGVSIFVKFDQTTHPRDLKWIVADKAEDWLKILSIKTGLGAFFDNDKIKVEVVVIDKHGKPTNIVNQGISFFKLHDSLNRSMSISEIEFKQDDLFKKNGPRFQLPARYKNLDAVFQYWKYDNIIELHENGAIKLDESEIEILNRHTPSIIGTYFYSAKVWDEINKSLNVRAGTKVINAGIQIAANNMPQGELIQIPLNRNIGRQNQIHYLIHFENCSADLGRKGFQSEIVDFAKEISKKLSDGPLVKVRHNLRVNTGAAPNLNREQAIDNWKTDMLDHEKINPLELVNQNFFLPTCKISITSNPSREQDVIALFNQLIAGGVIRGIKIMSTNERFTYDGLYKILIEEPTEHHLFNKDTNPLGIEKSVLQAHNKFPFLTSPKILEYKYSLDGLIEDIETGDKNSNDIGLVIVWETGSEYKHNYAITSYLDPDNLTLREFHGVTHLLTNLTSGQREMELIVLSELVEFLNNQETAVEKQKAKYQE